MAGILIDSVKDIFVGGLGESTLLPSVGIVFETLTCPLRAVVKRVAEWLVLTDQSVPASHKDLPKKR